MRGESSLLSRYASHLSVALLIIAVSVVGKFGAQFFSRTGPGEPPVDLEHAAGFEPDIPAGPSSELQGYLSRAVLPSTQDSQRESEPTPTSAARIASAKMVAAKPTEEPTEEPTAEPTREPTAGLALAPTQQPTNEPSPDPEVASSTGRLTRSVPEEAVGGQGGSDVETRTEITTYTVKQGDTVYDIAQRYEISGESILWANGKLEDNPDLLSVGQELVILPVSGILHVVEEGDSLASIAARYRVDMASIADFPGNDFSETYELAVGQRLTVPGGTKPYVPRLVFAFKGPVPSGAKKGTGTFGWPTTGLITQKFWSRHRGIDIGSRDGTPVYAADSGYVALARWSDVGYGRMVIIDHGNGFQTLYAHFGVYYVEEGQSVAKGEKIGLMGNTGNSTGPHLHFEISVKRVKRNPMIYLP